MQAHGSEYTIQVPSKLEYSSLETSLIYLARPDNGWRPILFAFRSGSYNMRCRTHCYPCYAENYKKKRSTWDLRTKATRLLYFSHRNCAYFERKIYLRVLRRRLLVQQRFPKLRIVKFWSHDSGNNYTSLVNARLVVWSSYHSRSRMSRFWNRVSFRGHEPFFQFYRLHVPSWQKTNFRNVRISHLDWCLFTHCRNLLHISS